MGREREGGDVKEIAPARRVGIIKGNFSVAKITINCVEKW